MANKQEVENFLRDFKVKMKIMNVVFRSDRDSNIQALADLDIRPIERETILKNLNVADYSEGPLEEKLHGGSDMWIFGKDINLYKNFNRNERQPSYLYFISSCETQDELSA